MQKHIRKQRDRHGFTLVEMLVVIGIILILAAILVPAVYMGLSAAQDARIVVELSNLDAAMRQYKTVTHGYSFPPNITTALVANTHIQQKFGRYVPATASAKLSTAGFDAGETLVFWLQGYGNNPLDPLADPGNATGDLSERRELFDFDESRLVATRVVDGFQLYHYYPRGGQNVPYVYFHHDNYAGSFTGTGTGTARPYKRDGGTDFANDDTFQIISAGQDGDWGADSTEKQFPSGLNYSATDGDNVTNFSGGTLADQIP